MKTKAQILKKTQMNDYTVLQPGRGGVVIVSSKSRWAVVDGEWDIISNVLKFLREEDKMKRSKKLKRKLAGRQYDYDNGVGKKDAKAYKRPGSNQ